MIVLDHIKNGTVYATLTDTVHGRPVSSASSIDEIDFIPHADAGDVAEMVTLTTVKMEMFALYLII